MIHAMGMFLFGSLMAYILIMGYFHLMAWLETQPSNKGQNNV
jgi:hypothetical protein